MGTRDCTEFSRRVRSLARLANHSISGSTSASPRNSAAGGQEPIFWQIRRYGKRGRSCPTPDLITDSINIKNRQKRLGRRGPLSIPVRSCPNISEIFHVWFHRMVLSLPAMNTGASPRVSTKGPRRNEARLGQHLHCTRRAQRTRGEI
jgi:hypothetical protein